jgi:hypothetical protein
MAGQRLLAGAGFQTGRGSWPIAAPGPQFAQSVFDVVEAATKVGILIKIDHQDRSAVLSDFKPILFRACRKSV